MSQSSSDGTCEHGNATELGESERHRLLAAAERRAVLAVVAERSGPFKLDEIAAAVAARDHAAGARDGPAETPMTGDATPSGVASQDLRIGLHHCHLPKLDAAGVVDYDPAAGRVERCGPIPTGLVESPDCG